MTLSYESGPYNSLPYVQPKRSARRPVLYGDRPRTKSGTRSSIYNKTRPPHKSQYKPKRRPTLLEQRCRPKGSPMCPIQNDQIDSAGPSNYKSYPVRAPFENRSKWISKYRPQKDQPRSQSQSQTNPLKGSPLEQHKIQIGMDLIGDSHDTYSHKMTYHNQYPNEAEPGEIFVAPPPSTTKNAAHYSDDLFMTAEDNSDNLVSTGIMTNPYTGEVFETFENAMPPPNTDQSLLPETFEKPNPRLIWLQGGIDQNAPLPTKKETCNKIPGPDHGPNIWGDQLYANERGRRLHEYVASEVWMNRDGDHSIPLGFAKEKPAGYVGLQPYIRAIPYLPPTQILDNKGYIPVTSQQFTQGEIVKPHVFFRKSDLTTCPRQPQPGPLTEIDSNHVVSDHLVRGTLKEQMEAQYSTHSIQTQQARTGGSSYVVTDPHVRGTLKEQMESQYGTHSIQTQQARTGGSSYVVTDPHARATLKEQMESQYGIHSIQTQQARTGGSSYVVTDPHARATLKEQMEFKHPVTTIETVVNDNWIPFQGPLEETRRQFYEKLPNVARPAHSAFLGTGDAGPLVSSGLVTTRQFRNMYPTYYAVPSKVPVDAKDTNARWIGESTQDTSREFVQNIPQADQLHVYQTTAPRMFGAVTAPCNLDTQGELENEFNSMTRGFMYPTQQAITG